MFGVEGQCCPDKEPVGKRGRHVLLGFDGLLEISI
jgi:hypothetical protein